MNTSPTLVQSIDCAYLVILATLQHPLYCAIKLACVHTHILPTPVDIEKHNSKQHIFIF